MIVITRLVYDLITLPYVVITVLYCTPSFYAQFKVVINVMPSKSLNLIGSIFPAHCVVTYLGKSSRHDTNVW